MAKASIWLEENRGAMGPGLKTGVVVGPEVQKTEARSKGLRASSPEFLFNIHKSFYFWKVITLESGLISNSCTGYNNISWKPYNHPYQNLGVATPQPSQDWHRRSTFYSAPITIMVSVSTWQRMNVLYIQKLGIHGCKLSHTSHVLAICRFYISNPAHYYFTFYLNANPSSLLMSSIDL